MSNSIENHIISYLYEQVDILAKEYEYIILIANFYSGTHKNKAKSQKADLEKNFNSMKELIEKEYDLLIEINNYIAKHLKHIREDQKDDIVSVFITIDYVRKDINRLIYKFEKINEKLIQMLRDGYNQYIPKPIIGKRHSNINIISQLELKINESRNIAPDNEFFITWKFTHSYKVLRLDSKRTMINLSYWLFDTPYLMPTITHEIIHKRINEFSDLTNILKNILHENSHLNATNNRKKIFKNQNNQVAIDSILEDITIDIISFLKHGNSYILTLATVHLGYQFASTFKRDKTNNSYEIAPWIFNQQRDISMLRLFILVNFIEKQSLIKELKNHDKFIQNSNEIKKINNIMKKLYFEEEGFQQIYSNYHNYNEEYQLITTFIKSFTTDILHSDSFIEEVKKKYLDEESNSIAIKERIKNLPETFNDIWEDRLNNTQSPQKTTKVEYRKKVHNKTIKKLLKKSYLSSTDILKAYQITFVKTKLPEIKDSNFDYLDFHSVQDDTYYNTLGIYDFVKISEPTPRNYSNENMLKKICKKKQHYKSFISLMKIMDDTLGKNENENKEFNAIIQIEIEKNLCTENIHDTYNELFKDLEKVRKIFTDNKIIKENQYEKVEFYKSLGPKDIVIIIYNCSIETIYTIKKAIGKESSLKRSYSTIFYDKNNDEHLHINNYNLSTEIRANNTNADDTTNIEDYLKGKQFTGATIHKIAGVMDYKIIWNTDIQLNTINSIYTTLIQEGHIQDLQTMISEKL